MTEQPIDLTYLFGFNLENAGVTAVVRRRYSAVHNVAVHSRQRPAVLAEQNPRGASALADKANGWGRARRVVLGSVLRAHAHSKSALADLDIQAEIGARPGMT